MTRIFYVQRVKQNRKSSIFFSAVPRWIDVPCPEDALVFNCGDYLSLLSKGRLK